QGGAPPRGDAIEFVHPAAASEPDLPERLRRLAIGAVFLPAGELSRDGGRWVFRPGPEPPKPVERTAVVLVVRSSEPLSTLLAAPEGADVRGAAHALAAGLADGLREGGPYGKVAGVHLQAPFSAATASRGSELLSALRKELPRGVLLSIALAEAPASDEERKRIGPLVKAADALTAPVFGAWTRVDSGAADALARPWWAGYDAAARCVLSDAGGQTRGDVPERYLDALAGHKNVEFENDLSVVDPDVVAFRLVARGPIRLDGLALEAGDRVACRLPSLAEMLYRLGSATAGKRHLLGRVIVFEGASESERLLRVEAFEDILLGRSLSPALEVRVQPAGRNAIAVEAVNLSPHTSTFSRVANWVEVDLAPAHPADVALGGFDRYEANDAAGRPVTPGRATRVRLFETLIAPREAISPARIVVRGALPERCCRHRTHVLSAAGPEEATDWAEPPPPPTPVPPAPKKRK
ncbi:MAG: hypothetical protein WAU32_09135, partial [Thermoanaerobaculia bacterium]